jgi:hypothetical protein
MFKYKLTWRLDDEEYFTTEEMEIEARCMTDLDATIKSVEKDHTLISIININL